MTDRPLGIGDAAVAEKVAGHRFFSATYRLFKLGGLEPQCEDYGQAVRYRGTIPGSERSFTLDKHHAIEAGRIFPVCGNTWKMLAETRFRPHFDVFGDFGRHYGVFAGCGTSLPFDDRDDVSSGALSSCC